jgi:hypothetical protein
MTACRESITAQLRRRRAASRRLPVIDSGHSDPWRYEPTAAGYPQAAQHLLEHGLTPAPDSDGLRMMRRAGSEHRRAAQVIAERWDLVA